VKNLLPLRTWLILAVIVVAVLALLSWRGACTAADQAGDQATIADARTDTARESFDIVIHNAAADAATQTEVQEAQDAVREADPADRERVARYQLCKLQAVSAC
jgi:ssDNA-binding replication factor A large subunit